MKRDFQGRVLLANLASQPGHVATPQFHHSLQEFLINQGTDLIGHVDFVSVATADKERSRKSMPNTVSSSCF